MTAINLFPRESFIPGVRHGRLFGAHGFTSDFGVSDLKGVVITGDGDDNVIYSVQLSGGTGTLSMNQATGGTASEVAITTSATAYYIAFGGM